MVRSSMNKRISQWVLCYAVFLASFSPAYFGGRDQVALAGEATEDSSVIVLDQNNFQQTINDHPLIMVEFYAPWCGHCKALEPKYEEAAKILKEDGIPLAKVDATVNEDLYWEHDIQGFPTLKLFVEGEEVDIYQGAREAAGLVRYLRHRASPLLAAGSTEALAAANRRRAGPWPLVLVALGGAGDPADPGGERRALVARLAQRLPRLAFAVDASPGGALAAELGLPQQEQEGAEGGAAAGAAAAATVTVLRDFAGGPVSIALPDASATTRIKLERFLKEEATPLVIEFGGEGSEWLWEPRPGYDVHALVFADRRAERHWPELRAELARAARAHLGDLTVVVADPELAPDLYATAEFRLGGGGGGEGGGGGGPEVRVVHSNARRQTVHFYRPGAGFDPCAPGALAGYFGELMRGEHGPYLEKGPDQEAAAGGERRQEGEGMDNDKAYTETINEEL